MNGEATLQGEGRISSGTNGMIVLSVSSGPMHTHLSEL